MPNGNGRKVLTPEENKLTFQMTQRSGKPAFVVEVPGCRFNGLPICLSTGDLAEVPKVHHMKHEFRKLWNKIAEKGIGQP